MTRQRLLGLVVSDFAKRQIVLEYVDVRQTTGRKQ
jgi:hypothetical protein